MLTTICHDLRNYFCKSKHFGKFKIEGGIITPLDFVLPNQYFRIIGSIFNEGVYQNPAEGLVDEEFEGAIWTMAVPKDLLELVAKIEEYIEEHGGQSYNPFISENYDKYSYTIGTNEDGLPISWRDIFGKELRRWQKI